MTLEAMTKNPAGRRLIYGAPVLAYAALIYLFSSVSKMPFFIPSFFGFDKLAHMGVYYLFGCLICRWLLSEENRFVIRHHLVLTVVIGTCYGLSDEWHQSFVPGRHASLWDVAFDALGIAAAAFTYPLLRRKIPFGKPFF